MSPTALLDKFFVLLAFYLYIIVSNFVCLRFVCVFVFLVLLLVFFLVFFNFPVYKEKQKEGVELDG